MNWLCIYLFRNKLNTTNAYCFNDISPHKARKVVISPTEPQRFTSFDYNPLQEVHQHCFWKPIYWKSVTSYHVSKGKPFGMIDM